MQMKLSKTIKLIISISLVLLIAWHWAGSIFVSEKWKKSLTDVNKEKSVVWLLNGDESVRLNMVDDLLRRYKLVGMSRTELEALLGKPPPTGYFANYDYVYWLGPERGFISIDSEWLCIKFKDDIVIDAKICRD